MQITNYGNAKRASKKLDITDIGYVELAPSNAPSVGNAIVSAGELIGKALVLFHNGIVDGIKEGMRIRAEQKRKDMVRRYENANFNLPPVGRSQHNQPFSNNGATYNFYVKDGGTVNNYF